MPAQNVLTKESIMYEYEYEAAFNAIDVLFVRQDETPRPANP